MPNRSSKVEIKKGEVTITEHQLLKDIKRRLDVLIAIGNAIVDDPVTLDDVKEF